MEDMSIVIISVVKPRMYLTVPDPSGVLIGSMALSRDPRRATSRERHLPH